MERSDAFETGDSALGVKTQQWLQALPATAYVTDAGWWLGQVSFLGHSVATLAQRPSEEFLAHPERWLDQIPELARRAALEQLQNAQVTGEARVTLRYRLVRPDGSECQIEDSLSIQRDAGGGITALVGLLREASERSDDEADTPDERSLLAHVGDLVLTLDDELHCVEALGAASELLGMPAAQLQSQSLFGLMAPEDGARVQRTLLDHAAEGRSAMLEVRLRHLRGGYRWFEIHFSPYATVSAATPGWVAIARDITERRHQSLQWDAYTATDELTSALNREAFMGLLRHALSLEGGKLRLTLILFDVDHLCDINQAWGREGGDLVLTCIGEMCRATLRERFSFGRLEDDTFALLLSGKSLQESASIAERLRERFASTRVEFHGHWLSFSVSLGVAERRADESAESFLQRADGGLRGAKAHGRDRVQQAL
ncbi:sensor domain-containing diguanylate cyclase [Salinicola avicenniae]|uniref:sensor domain-containing diguanylate cyclase n=1 Tax=Salinicola avicenniae TaxID=2916836 RepID=UPI00207304C5|nr:MULTISPECIES: sensor domain-containing diguanylate cyclase [unclassified Salinicola]